MTSAFPLQLARVVDGKTLIGLKHTAKDPAGAQVSTDGIDMPPEDMQRLVKTLQQTLAELPPR